MASAFNTQGALPSFNAVPNQSFNVMPQTSVGKALSNSANMSTVNGPKVGGVGPTIQLPVAPTNQPVKSHTVNNVDGSSVTQTYHPPTDTSQTNTQTVQGGILNAPGVGGTNGTPSDTSTGSYTTPNGATVNGQGGILSPSPTAPTASQGAISGLLSTASNVGNEVNSGAQNIASLRDQLARATNVYSTSGLALPVAQGREQALSQTEAAEESGIQAGINNEIAGAGAQTTALNNAGTLGLPANQNVQVPYSNQYLDASTGQPVGGSTGSALQTAVNNAIEQIKNGAGYDAANSTLGSFGPAGTNALLSALGPNFNINSSNAEAAAAAQNIGTQGTSQTTIGQGGLADSTKAYTDATTYNNTASSQAQTLQSIMASTGINSSSSPLFTTPINKLQSNLGSDNYSKFITGLSELQNSYSQLLSTGGGTPTQQDATALATLDPSKTASQINAAISTLQQDAYDKLNSLYGNVQTYQNLLNGGGSTNTNSNANTTSNIYSF